jgi:PPOX class probable F420-dependent enzyme
VTATGRIARVGSGTEPGPLRPNEFAEFMTRPLVARVASIGDDGYPHITPMWHCWRDESVWLVSRRQSRVAAYVRSRPRVCVSVASDDLPYSRVTIYGTATVVNPGAPSPSDWHSLLYDMAARYLGDCDPTYASRTEGLARWVIRVTPERMTSWRGGGWPRVHEQG